jgi:hypothetical protein
MAIDDREKQFERALARHLRNASPDSACPDAEVLAAYHERTLSLEEMAQWKEHIAGCARCRESLALVEQSEHVTAEGWDKADVPVLSEELAGVRVVRAADASFRQKESSPGVPPVAAEPAPQIRRTPVKWRWLVPMGALAAGLLVWVGLREGRMRVASESDRVRVAENRPAAPQPPQSNYAAADEERRQEPSTRKSDAQTPAPKPLAPSPPKTAPPAGIGSGGGMGVGAPAPLAEEEVASKQKDLGGVAGGVIGGSVPSAGPEAPALRDDAKNAPEAQAVTGMAAPVAPAGASANRLKLEAKKAPGPSQTQQANVQSQTVEVQAYDKSAQLGGRMRSQADLIQVAANDRRYIVAPGETHAWRTGDGGRIERSTDGGKTWKPQNSRVRADLTAGSATSDKVCWIVGKAGTVLLTTDGGKHWKQISTPITDDLGGVHATDAFHASIWDVPNRNSYETSDGGATWQRLANN